jgi:hypothetical protein
VRKRLSGLAPVWLCTQNVDSALAEPANVTSGATDYKIFIHLVNGADVT